MPGTAIRNAERSFAYDGAGNATSVTSASGTVTSWGYNNAGRLKTVTVGGSLRGSYAYDALERLAVRQVTNFTPSGTTHFVHLLGGGGLIDDLMPAVGRQTGGLGNRVIVETDGAGTTVREYVWLGDLILMVVDDANTTAPKMWWVTNDHLGRPVQMTNGSKAVVWRTKYRPFGRSSGTTGTPDMDLRFPDLWFQAESGLGYNWHRHYDIASGRYLQPDPLGFVDGPSVYGYARQNPLTWTDPEGRDTAVVVGHGTV